MRIHFIQHVPFENPAFILDWAAGNHFPLSSTKAYANEPYPAFEDFDLLIIMGGPMSVNDEGTLPWLITEKKFVKSAITGGKIVIGICLGAQIIASVCNAQVKSNNNKEIGWFPINFNDTGCSSIGLPLSGEIIGFHWHGETFDLPEGSTWLASSDACINQAFSLGNKVFGFQFHLEANNDSISKLIVNCENELDNSTFVQSKEEMMSLMHFAEKANNAMQNFLDWIVKLHF